MKTVRHGLGVVCACGIALLSNSAQAASAISIDKYAKLANNRVALTLTGSYICDPFDPFPWINFSVTQAAGKVVAYGYGTIYSPVCDNTQQSYSLVVEAQPGTPPFHSGSAQADAYSYMNNSQTTVHTSQNISITRGGR